MGSFEIADKICPCLVVGGASAPIMARFFHLSRLECKVVGHAYNLCIHIWAVTACGVRLAVINLGENGLNWRVCVPFAFHTVLIVDEFVRCNMVVCVEEFSDDSARCDTCIPCVAVFVNLDVFIVYVGERLLFEHVVYSMVSLEGTYCIVEGTACLKNLRAGIFLRKIRSSWWICQRKVVDVAQA